MSRVGEIAFGKGIKDEGRNVLTSFIIQKIIKES